MISPSGLALPPSPMSLNRATVVLDCLLKGAWTPRTPFSPSSGRHRDNSEPHPQAITLVIPIGACVLVHPAAELLCATEAGSVEVGKMWADGSRDRSRENCVRKQASAKPFDGGGKHSTAAKHGRLFAVGHFSQLLVWRLASVQRRNPETSENRAGWIKICGI